MIATVFDIKRCSLNDGPGIRTTVFFKGCNLNCFWCHNPEGISPKKQYAFFRHKCTNCGACGKHKGKSFEELAFYCPSQARKVYGREYTVEELFDIIIRDKDYYSATGGGVTFSGGECMLQIGFISELAKRCKENGISVAVDTAGNVPYENFERILPYSDVFLYDVKCIDKNLHKNGTGCDNTLILKNLDRLINTDKNIIVRVPVIPDFNDGEELEKIKSYCAERALKVEFLVYHQYGKDKRSALNYKSENNE